MTTVLHRSPSPPENRVNEQSHSEPGGTYRQRHSLENLVFWRQGIRELHILEIVGAAAILGSFCAVAVHLTDSPTQPREPKIVVGGLIGLGEAWELSVSKSWRHIHRLFGLTARKTKSQRGGLAREVNAHERHYELIQSNFPIVDQL